MLIGSCITIYHNEVSGREGLYVRQERFENNGISGSPYGQFHGSHQLYHGFKEHLWYHDPDKYNQKAVLTP